MQNSETIELSKEFGVALKFPTKEYIDPIGYECLFCTRNKLESLVLQNTALTILTECELHLQTFHLDELEVYQKYYKDSNEWYLYFLPFFKQVNELIIVKDIYVVDTEEGAVYTLHNAQCRLCQTYGSEIENVTNHLICFPIVTCSEEIIQHNIKYHPKRFQQYQTLKTELNNFWNPTTTPILHTHNHKRSNYLSWDDYFMGIAFLSAQRSKDPRTQVGACIVNKERKIVGIGYNGFPNGCNDDDLPWAKEADVPLNTKYPYVCHAEMNAILNKNSIDVKCCTLYVALFPCNECTKLIIQSGITTVIYMSDKYHSDWKTVASRRMLDMAGVKYRQHVLQTSPLLTINFLAID